MTNPEIRREWSVQPAESKVQIPEPRRHGPRYYGFYSNAARGKRRIARTESGESASEAGAEGTDEADPPHEVAARRRRWADLLRRIYEVDPLVCRCGGTMRIISFITEPRVIERMDHVRRQKPRARGSPGLIATSPALA